jgi:hypothetical protein
MIELVREQCGLRNNFISHNRYRPNNRLVWNQENQPNVLRTLFDRIRSGANDCVSTLVIFPAATRPLRDVRPRL